MSNLNDLVVESAGWELREATGVNNKGAIVGWGTIEGREEAFLFESGQITRIGVLPAPMVAMRSASTIQIRW